MANPNLIRAPLPRREATSSSRRGDDRNLVRCGTRARDTRTQTPADFTAPHGLQTGTDECNVFTLEVWDALFAFDQVIDELLHSNAVEPKNRHDLLVARSFIELPGSAHFSRNMAPRCPIRVCCRTKVELMRTRCQPNAARRLRARTHRCIAKQSMCLPNVSCMVPWQ